MARTKGAKDLKPRRMNPASLATLATGIPGHRSATVRIYGPAADVRWFERMDSKDRGQIITNARQHATP